MNLLKSIAEVIVRRAGYQVPTGESPLKGVTGKAGGFAQMLSGMQGKSNSMTMPTPPTPPENPADVEAQRKYNEALLAYNQQFQAYQTSIMSMFFQRFQMMQQAMMQTQRSQAASNSQISSPVGNASSIGSILGSSDI